MSKQSTSAVLSEGTEITNGQPHTVDRQHHPAQLQSLMDQPQSLGSLAKTVTEFYTALDELLFIQAAIAAVPQPTGLLADTRQTVAAVQRRCQKMFDTTSSGYLVTDLFGVIQEANPAARRLLASSRRELIGEPLSVYVPLQDRYPFRVRLAQAGASDNVQPESDWHLRLQPPHSSPFQAVVAVSPIHDRTGRSTGLCWLLHDMTRFPALAAALRQTREKFEQRLREQTAEVRTITTALQKALLVHQRADAQWREGERVSIVGVTAEHVSHEIGNTLNSLSSTVHLLKRSLAQPSPPDTDHASTLPHALVQDLISEINRLRLFLEEWRSVTRRLRFHFEPVSVADVMTEVLVLYTPLYAARHIQVEYAVPVDLPLVRADPERLSQVFLYLFRNATEAMPHGGTLHIRGAIADGQGTQVAIEVADTGQGIPAGISIFDLFTTTKPRRLGLGLAIVRYILDIHQSTISYTSLPGYGTCFRLRLPCSAQSSRTVRYI